MNRTVLDLWVGIFVVGGIFALMFLALRVGNAGETYNVAQTYQLVGYFDNIGGLKKRAPVKSAGVVVGRVTSIEFDNQKFSAKVTMSIGAGYKFDKDTTATILTSGLLGEQYIGLEAGGNEKVLQNGDTIKLTQSALVLEKLIGIFLTKQAEGGGSK